jgi:hypothetical protein
MLAKAGIQKSLKFLDSGMTLNYSTDIGNTTLADLTRNITYTETNKLSATPTVNVVQD